MRTIEVNSLGNNYERDIIQALSAIIRKDKFLFLNSLNSSVTRGSNLWRNFGLEEFCFLPGYGLINLAAEVFGQTPENLIDNNWNLSFLVLNKEPDIDSYVQISKYSPLILSWLQNLPPDTSISQLLE